MAARYGSLPFNEQIAFFRRKLNLGTRAWTDIFEAQHDHAFVVAGAMKAELLTDLRQAVDSAIAGGTTIAQFRKDFDQIVATHGWSYRGGRGWRTRVIYDTNLRTSYAAGRYQQMKAAAAERPYWQYEHSDSVAHPRPQHLAWDGLILRNDDPWWHTHFPPNGWGCRCRVRTLAPRDLARMKKDGPDQAPPTDMQEVLIGTRGPTPRLVRTPRGVDPGFGYAPGASAQKYLDAFVPGELDELPASASAARAADALPLARRQPASRVLPAGMTDRAYIDAFLREFGARAGERTIFEDVTGEYLVIGDRLFARRDGSLKIGKSGRARNVLLLADALKLPDEIWEDFADVGGRNVLRRRYVARFQIGDSDQAAMAAFDIGPEGWTGVTAFAPDELDYLDRRVRRGRRIYKRE